MAIDLKTHSRYGYVGIRDRQQYSWPEGKRLAVYIGLNLESFSFGEGLGACLAPSIPGPDVLNFSWRDYGNRVGAWRLLDLFESLGFPLSVLVNTSLYDSCSDLLAMFRLRGDEFVAHGRTNAERQGDMKESDEKKLIAEVCELIKKHEGKAPAGWLGPWISESFVTPDLLQEAGYKYVLDWAHDDQPTWMKTRSGGKLLAVPYPQEVNDIPAIVARHMTAAEFSEMIVDQFDELREQSLDQPLVCGIALHPYVVGQPFRLRHLRKALSHIANYRETVWLCRTGEIADCIYAQQESHGRAP